MVKCVLSCQNMGQTTEINLSDSLKDMSSIDFSKCTAVFEDGSYDINFFYGLNSDINIESDTVCVNGE